MRIDPAEVARLILEGQAPPEDWIPHIVELRLERSYITNLRQVALLTGLRSSVTDAIAHQRYRSARRVDPTAALCICRSPPSATWHRSRSWLNLEGCFLTGSLVDDIAPLAGLTRLERLDLGDTQITDATPLIGLRNLRSLDLSATRITDIAPLASLTALQFLDLTGTPVTDLTPLVALTNLRWLIMRNTHADVSPLSRLVGCHVITAVQVPRRARHRHA